MINDAFKEAELKLLLGGMRSSHRGAFCDVLA